MSELEKFEGSDAWFARLKSLLFMERPRRVKEDICGTTELKPVVDFSKEFLEELKRHKDNMPNSRNKENCDPEDGSVNEMYSSKQESSMRYSTLSQNTTCFNTFSSKCQSHNDSTFYDEPSILRQTTDESFERVEQMCNKSASDPDSTLFQYMRSFKESKKTSEEEEVQALDRLLKEFNIMNALPLADQTQLENIEEPTGIWDNTLAPSDDTTCRQNPSPVKMVGLLRPSTILEESSSSDTTDTSSFSYQTAQKEGYASSDNYDTASDKITVTKIQEDKNNCNMTVDSLEKTLSYEVESETSKSEEQTTNSTNTDSESSSASYTVNKTEDTDISSNYNFTNSFKSSSKSEESNSTNFSDISAQSKPEINIFPQKKHKFYEEDISQGLISCNATYNILQEKGSHEISADSLYQTKNTLSGVSSLTEDSLNSKQDLIDLNNSSLRTPRRSAVVKAKSTIIELSDDEDDLNEAFSLNLNKTRETEASSSLNISREFNDTIEEMEYIMQQGMKYMTEKGNTPKMVQSVVLSSTKPAISISTKTLSPGVSSLKGLSPKPSPYTPKETISKVIRKAATSCEKSRIGDTFKKPTAFSSTRIPQSKSIFGVKKSNYSHIISPVGAYIKHTPKVPLTANVKPTQNVYQSKAVRELEYESRTLPSQVEAKSSTKTFPSLPKKAYISAEYKHVIDERTPVVIPGGDKIHRYLQPSASVIRHEGKLKMNMPPPMDSMNAPLNRTVNSSLADLSLMSGDVSLLTIKDAKKNLY